jgi:hypothetical protein
MLKDDPPVSSMLTMATALDSYFESRLIHPHAASDHDGGILVHLAPERP